ncbi:MAG: hypothetical protein WBW41_02015 [Verrucomicrobiia bacterium]
MTNSAPDQEAPTIKQCAFALGLHEFSLFSRIQVGDITPTRLRSGILAIPVSELERLAKLPIHSLVMPQATPAAVLPDSRLGIKRDRYYYHGLMWDGEPREYAVPGDIIRHFTETEIKGYRAAFSAIANEFEYLTELKKQLEKSATVSTSLEKEICTSRIGVWQVHSTLLNLGQSDILLCQRQNEFAVIERFRDESPYAKANGNAEITLEGNDARQLAAAFHANASHTLEFMASNQVATAQKVIWEQFPDHRPAQLVASLSERCRLAVTNEETISQTRKLNQSTGGGMRI